MNPRINPKGNGIDIKTVVAGDVLRLRPARQLLYGLACGFVRVEAVRASKGHEAAGLFVIGEGFAFRPADFARKMFAT